MGRSERARRAMSDPTLYDEALRIPPTLGDPAPHARVLETLPGAGRPSGAPLVPPSAEVALAEALVAAMAELSDVKATKEAKVVTRSGEKYTYWYADLPDVHAVVRPVLAAHGLAALQNLYIGGHQVRVTTQVLHRLGAERWFGPVEFDYIGGPQAAGSAATYARRYGLCSALGIAADVDDDGGAAQTEQAESAPPTPPHPQGRRPAAPGGASSAATADAPTGPDLAYAVWSVASLSAEARRRGIDLAGMRKADLVAALVNDDKGETP